MLSSPLPRGERDRVRVKGGASTGRSRKKGGFIVGLALGVGLASNVGQAGHEAAMRFTSAFSPPKETIIRDEPREALGYDLASGLPSMPLLIPEHGLVNSTGAATVVWYLTSSY